MRSGYFKSRRSKGVNGVCYLLQKFEKFSSSQRFSFKVIELFSFFLSAKKKNRLPWKATALSRYKNIWTLYCLMHLTELNLMALVHHVYFILLESSMSKDIGHRKGRTPKFWVPIRKVCYIVTKVISCWEKK